MKTSIVIAFIFSLLATGCSTTTYLSLTKNDKEQIEQKLNDYEHDEDVGAEITISKKNGTEINGELLSVRDTSIIICSDIGISENELARINHPIYNIRNSEIKELTVEGGNYIWSGAGYGAAGGALAGAITIYAIDQSQNNPKLKEGAAIIIGGGLGALVGAIAGGIVGYALSTDDVVLQDIPPGHDCSFLKPFARYPDEEPEYLKAIE